MRSRRDSTRLFAQDVRVWLEKRTRDFGTTTNDFSVSPYRRD